MIQSTASSRSSRLATVVMISKRRMLHQLVFAQTVRGFPSFGSRRWPWMFPEFCRAVSPWWGPRLHEELRKHESCRSPFTFGTPRWIHPVEIGFWSPPPGLLVVTFGLYVAVVVNHIYNIIRRCSQPSVYPCCIGHGLSSLYGKMRNMLELRPWGIVSCTAL